MKENQFITSDTHFWHTNIIKFCKRPFFDAKRMNDCLVERWNQKVPKNATVWHLGDFAFHHKADVLERIVRQLNGQIRIILGNHDEKKEFEKVAHLFAEIIPSGFVEHRVNRRKIVMCHYPMASWNGSHDGSVMLHGHCHGTLEELDGRLDVGVDCHGNYEPFSYDEVMERIAT